jgi:translocation and assembly module TamB
LISFLYLTYRNTTLFVLAFILLVSVALFHKDVVPTLAQKYAKEYGVEYSHIEGNLFFGFKIEEFKYRDFVTASSLDVKYNLLSLIRKTPKIESIRVDSLYIDVEKIPSSNTKSQTHFEPRFIISKIILNKSDILYKKEHYRLSLDAKESYYSKLLNVKTVQTTLKTPYGSAKATGSITQNRLKIKTSIEPSSTTTKEYLSFLKTPPKSLLCDIDVDKDRVKLLTHIKTIVPKELKELSLKNLSTQITFSFKEKRALLNATYNLSYKKYKLKVTQSATYRDKVSLLNSHIESKILKTPINLPLKNFTSDINATKKELAIAFNSSKLHYKISSKDYKKFNFSGEGEILASLIKGIPELLKKEQITFQHSGSYSSLENSLKSHLVADTTSTKLDIELLYKKKTPSVSMTIVPKRDSQLFKKYQLQNFSPTKLSYKKMDRREYIKIDANLLQLNLIKESMKLKGEGTFASNPFTLKSDLATKKPLEIELKTEVKSLKKTLKNLTIESKKLATISDIELNIESRLVFQEPFVIDSTLKIPSLSIKSDEQTTQLFENIEIKSSVTPKRVTLHKYNFEYKEFSIYSNRESTILLNDKSIEIEKLWIFDNLLLKGLYTKEQNVGRFSLESDNFHYKHKDATFNAKIDLNAKIDSNSTNISGDIEILKAVVSYMPTSNYAISDPDIIIIQEQKRKKDSKLTLNIKLHSKKDILYKHKDIKVYLKPNIEIIKESHKDITIKGEVLLNRGEIKLEDKKFTLSKSSLYFNNTNPINPQLMVKLHYITLDYRDILISITHTLKEPIFILSSNPQMSQNDIMSYLLFGESANSMFDEKGDGSTTSLLLATGVKELFNANSKIKLDTLNLLTNSDGKIGYEIGSRFNKNMRVIYRNDTISSFILQYSLSNSTRIDVDVRETGQGVSFIYMKDFKH